MKIALVCFNLSWQAGGVRLIYSQAHALEKLGHKVAVYTPEFDENVYPDLWKGLDIRLVAPDQPPVWQYSSSNLFVRIFEKIKQRHAAIAMAEKIAGAMDVDFEVVNLHDFSYKIAPFYVRRNPKARIVWYMADPPYMHLPKSSFLYNLLSKIFNRYADLAERKYFRAIHAGATLVKRNQKWMEERGMPTKIAWSGIDFPHFYAPPRDIAGKKSFTLMTVGALNKYRRFEDVIDALALIRKEGHDAKLVIVCKNIWKEDAYAKELARFVEDRGMRPYTRLMFEGAGEDELKNLYAASDFFVVPIHLPPPRNGFGWQLVVFEAIAAGMPTVVCNTNDVSEALVDGKTALFVDPLKPDQIAAKVISLITDPELYKKIALAGQEFVRKAMSWEKFAEEVLDAAALKD